MKGKVFRLIFTVIFTLGLAIPGAAIAGDNGKGCRMQGTWFGVTDLVDKMPSGWVVTATGQSADHGVNVLEYPTYDSTFGGLYGVLYHSANRGVWERISGHAFKYSFMSILVGEDLGGNRIPLYYLRVSGIATQSDDCMAEEITAVMDFFAGDSSPFEDEPLWSIPLPTHYGYRFTLD